MELDEQLAQFDRLSELAYERCLQELADDRKRVVREARARLIENYQVYEDASWHHPPASLSRDRREEFADALNYTVMLLRQLGL